MAAKYLGDIQNACTTEHYDFSKAFVVVVSGDGINACGHMLLNTNGRTGWYFHVAAFHDYPRYMGYEGYKRYLKENKKRELGFYHKVVPNSTKALLRLEELMSKKWLFGGLPHNCVAFVEKVLQAGGSSFGLLSNCPEMAVTAHEWQKTINQVRRSTTDEALMRYFLSR